MSDFQLILLEGVPRAAREAPKPGEFSLIRYRTRAEIAMAELALTAEDIAGWLLAHEALEIAKEAFGDAFISKRAILERLKGRQIMAAAESSSWVIGPRNTRQLGPTPIDNSHWGEVASHELDQFWITSQMRVFRSHYQGFSELTIRFFGIRFEPSGVHALVAHAPQKKPKVTPAATANIGPVLNKGGRPRKEWWDDFWIAICGQIYEGDLKPQRQADLERAMLDWVENHPSAEAGETTIKAAAKRLFNAWKLGVKN